MDFLTVGERIMHYRKQKGLKQVELAKLADISPTALNYYEKNKRSPDVEVVRRLAAALSVTGDDIIGTQFAEPIKRSGTSLDPLDRTHLTEYKKLSDLGKEKATAYVIDIQPQHPRTDNIVNFPAEAEEAEENIRELPLYDMPASAGTGFSAGSGKYDIVTVSSDVPMSANFGVRISGDSMLPEVPNGSIVWVKQQPDVEIGEMCIVVKDDNGFCKIKEVDRFVSLNPSSPDVAIGEFDDYVIKGRVVYVQEGV